MKEQWEALIAILSDTVSLYKGLAKIGEEKRRALIEADTAGLDAVTRREELIILEGARLEERRAKATAVLANTNLFSHRRPTLSELKNVAEPEVAEQLGTLSNELEAAVQSVVRINETNTRLIRQALHFVNYNLNLLTGSQAESTYRPTGGKVTNGSRSAVILDRKI